MCKQFSPRVCALIPLAGCSGLGRKSGTEKAPVPTLILERPRMSSGRGLGQLPARACSGGVGFVAAPGLRGRVGLGLAPRRPLAAGLRVSGASWITQAGGLPPGQRGSAVRLVFRARLHFALAGVCSLASLGPSPASFSRRAGCGRCLDRVAGGHGGPQGLHTQPRRLHIRPPLGCLQAGCSGDGAQVRASALLLGSCPPAFPQAFRLCWRRCSAGIPALQGL